MNNIICSCHNREFNTKKDLYMHYRYLRTIVERKKESKKYDLEHREEKRKYMLVYSFLNAKKVYENSKKWNLGHKEEKKNYMKEYGSKYYNTFEGKLAKKAANHTRRIRRGIRLTKRIVQEKYEDNIKKYGTLTCCLCFKPIEFGEDSLEHLIPLCRQIEFPDRDLTALSNLDISHISCNKQKYDKTLEEWFQLHPENVKQTVRIGAHTFFKNK